MNYNNKKVFQIKHFVTPILFLCSHLLPFFQTEIETSVSSLGKEISQWMLSAPDLIKFSTSVRILRMLDKKYIIFFGCKYVYKFYYSNLKTGDYYVRVINNHENDDN